MLILKQQNKTKNPHKHVRRLQSYSRLVQLNKWTNLFVLSLSLSKMWRKSKDLSLSFKILSGMFFQSSSRWENNDSLLQMLALLWEILLEVEFIGNVCNFLLSSASFTFLKGQQSCLPLCCIIMRKMSQLM